MKFIDECELDIKAGKGGDGIVSFRREARVSRGGPDGGDGGKGGSIFFVGEPGMNTLINLKLLRTIKGNGGENGRPKNQYGAAGKNRYVKVPLGTLVYNGKKLIADIIEQKEYLIAHGGYGGKGNVKFKSSRNTAPRLSENGTKGEMFKSRLVLKILADVGFVGKPSAGKSTLLSKISNAKPKIADYHFTTLTPQLGFVQINNNSFVAADLPGLIKGASMGKGLGHDFLKHIERCRVIAHIIDFGSDEKKPIDDFNQINKELKNYSLGLENKKQVVIANKNDTSTFYSKINDFKKKFSNIDIVEISALKEHGLDELKRKLYDAYITSEEIVYDTTVKEVTIQLEDDVIVKNLFEGMFEVEGKLVQEIYDLIPLNTNANFNRFNGKMKDAGVWSKLRKSGVKNGDTIRIYGYEFEWSEEE